MACSIKTSEITLEAATVSWMAEELTKITPVTGLTGGEYFTFSTPTISYYVWFTVNAIGADPAVAGKTGIQVDLPTAYTLAQLIALTKTAIEALKVAYVHADTDNTCFLIENKDAGAVLVTATAGDSGFTVEVLKAGFSENLGKTKDGVEVSFEATTFDVTADETGTLILDQIIQGTSASMGMTLLEVSKAKLEKLIGNGFGATYTPAGGTALVGFGTSKNFKSSYAYAGKLVLHPIRLATVDKSEDVTFWKTILMPESINYSGTDAKGLSVSFTALVDERKPAEISLFAVGDSTQFLA